MSEQKKYSVGGINFSLRGELLAEDWELFTRASEIVGEIRKRKVTIDTDKQEIEISAGDFTKEEFREFASFGFVGPDNKNMTKEQATKLTLADAMDGFTNFFFSMILLEMSWNRSGQLKKKLNERMTLSKV